MKVVLTGEGSDELFAGYERYRFYLLNERWLERYNVVARAAARLHPRASSHRRTCCRRRCAASCSIRSLGVGETIESLYLDNFYSAFRAGEQQRWSAAAERLALCELTCVIGTGVRDASPLSRMLYADQKTYLVELLMKQDQMSMATSIESRVPFLDHTFVEFASRVPDHMKLRGPEGKYILKKAVEDLLPHDIIYRKKMGFPTPLRQWLMDPRAKPLFDTLRQKDGLVQSFLDRAQSRPCWTGISAGSKTAPTVSGAC